MLSWKSFRKKNKQKLAKCTCPKFVRLNNVYKHTPTCAYRKSVGRLLLEYDIYVQPLRCEFCKSNLVKNRCPSCDKVYYWRTNFNYYDFQDDDDGCNDFWSS